MFMLTNMLGQRFYLTLRIMCRNAVLLAHGPLPGPGLHFLGRNWIWAFLAQPNCIRSTYIESGFRFTTA